MAAKKAQGTAKRTSPGQTPIAKAVSPVPHFSPEGPPKDWERQHAAPRGRTILGVPTWNQGAMPVPRNAS
jgi:hypothetical protein